MSLCEKKKQQTHSVYPFKHWKCVFILLFAVPIKSLKQFSMENQTIKTIFAG